ncbi:N-acetylmuramidase domain-containing protein [Alteromonas sp. 14N.309.X.WAT.G.H12]|uniref:N-acetylmuramidase domain-containing protein n=1 Tax=Alteromonas sp. 14N.309.X.WAT.G.H12 TaxID=3120824 RepID=UPI002FCEDD58
MLGAVVPQRLNVRSMPMTTSSVLCRLTENEVVRGEAEINGWWQVRYRDTIGFVHGAYIKPINDVSRLSGAVNTPRLNVRTGPSPNATYLATLTKGASVKTLAILDGWLEIEFNHQTAYVASPYVDLTYSSSGYPALVTANLLNVRAAPSRTASIFGQLAQNNRIWVEGTLQGWSQIRFNGNRGYVSNAYIVPDDTVGPESDMPVAMVDHENDTIDAIPKRSDDNSLLPLTPPVILPVTGNSEQRAVATTWNRFGALLIQLCEQKQVGTGASVAVLCVESGGKGFEQNNSDKMIIRFENHKFWQYWGRHNAAQFNQHFRYRSDKVWLGHEWRKSVNTPWQPFHGRQTTEWEVFEFARLLNEEAAMLSISMGAPQIMGFNHERIGYRSVTEMFDAFSSHIQYQIGGLFEFFSPQMLQYLRDHDFVNFAGMYNGAGQKAVYGEKIRKHYEAFTKLMPNTDNK